MRAKIGFSILVLLTLGIGSSLATACSCIDFQPRELLESDDIGAVFSGEVIELRLDRYWATESDSLAEIRPGGNGRVLADDLITTHHIVAVFEVDMIWKGAVGRELEVLTGSGFCSSEFRIGSTYLVYARKIPELGFYTNICYRTRRIHEAGEDLEALGEPQRILSTERFDEIRKLLRASPSGVVREGAAGF